MLKAGNIVFLGTTKLTPPRRNTRRDICSLSIFLLITLPQKPPVKTTCHLLNTIFTYIFFFIFKRKNQPTCICRILQDLPILTHSVHSYYCYVIA